MKPYRFYVRSPDGRQILGFDRKDVAETVAMEYGVGAAIIDTLAQAYHPMLQTVVSGREGPALNFAPIGGWDTGRFTPERDLIEAIKKGSAAIVHAFLAKGASADAKDANGGSALHWAAGRKSGEIVQLLLTHGADSKVTDAKGQTPADVAQARGADDVVARLRRSGG